MGVKLDEQIGATPPADRVSGPVAQHIARAAARLFATRGYDATSVREIVEAAGVTKPTLYYYFGSKEGLGQALLHDPMAGLAERLRGILDATTDPVAAIAGMMQAHFEFCREDADRSRFLYAVFFGPLSSGLAAEIARIGQALDGVWDDAARRLVAAGMIPAGSEAACTDHIKGLIVVHTIDFLYKGRELGADLGVQLVRDLLGGLANRDGERRCAR